MGSDKLALELDGRPILGHVLGAVAAAAAFGPVVVVTPPERWPAVEAIAAGLGLAGSLRLVAGGSRRQDSVRAGLGLATSEAVDIVCVHDAARPLCPPGLFIAVVEAARRHGAATAALPVVDTVKRVDPDGRVVATLDRADLVAVQTPQAFTADLLVEAHRRALAEGWTADDDAALVERLGALVVIVAGDARNLKVTRPADLALLRAAMAAAP